MIGQPGVTALRYSFSIIKCAPQQIMIHTDINYCHFSSSAVIKHYCPHFSVCVSHWIPLLIVHLVQGSLTKFIDDLSVENML